MFENYPDVVTVADLCKMIGVCKQTAYRLVNSGKVPSKKVGSKILIPKQGVIEFFS